MTKIIYATTNPGKFSEVKQIFKSFGIELHSPTEFGQSLKIEETGTTLKENACLKAEAYLKLFPDDIIIGDDTGVEIDALGGEPGIYVRRWKGYEMTDEEIIEYCLEKMKDVEKEDRSAQFHTVLAVARKGHKAKYFEGYYKGMIMQTPSLDRELGFPFRSLFEHHDPSHRRIATIKLINYLQKILS